MPTKLSSAQACFLWQAAQPIGKHASAVNPTAQALEEHGLIYMAQIVSPARLIALWLATEKGHEHPAAKDDAA